MTTVEEIKMSDMERGFPSRKFNGQDTSTKIKTDIATKISEYIKLNEGDEAVKRWSNNSIYKVPAPMAAVNPEAFTPKMVSMGPYHHGEDQLKHMEVHKHRAARCFFGRSTKPIEDYIEALWKVLQDLRHSYSQLPRHFWMENDNEGRFLTLMLIDGCFLLEMLNVYNKNFDGYGEHDPIFSDQGTRSNPQIASDLMMLENQVPFTAIETILTVQNDKTPPDEICKKIKNLMSNAILEKPHPELDASRGLHMLDIVRKAFVEQDEFEVGENSMTEGQSLRWRLMERHPCKEDAHHPRRKMKGAGSVMALRRGGVEFKVAKDDSHSSIEFKNGALTIPINQISIESEIRVCNMVAFELLHPKKFPSTLCYYTFMNGLLNSVADAKHLRSKGIITGTESRDYVIFKTFKKLVPVNMPMHPLSNLHDIQDELNKFYIDRMTGCKGKVWEWIANWKHIWIPILKKTYLKNPWKIISLVGATILLALTMAQTYYAARTYLDASHKKN